MKILVYGAGVIGGQLAHALMTCGNDVTVIARLNRGSRFGRIMQDK